MQQKYLYLVNIILDGPIQSSIPPAKNSVWHKQRQELHGRGRPVPDLYATQAWL